MRVFFLGGTEEFFLCMIRYGVSVETFLSEGSDGEASKRPLFLD